MLESADTVSLEHSANANQQLRTIIETSDTLRRNAKRVHKAAQQ
jgi:hypothetical protein